MNARLGTIGLLIGLLVLAAFVWLTSRALPEVVASHFGSSGAADGFMPRAMYVSVLMVLIVGVPLLIAFLPGAVGGKGGRRLNIPNREYWLAPERRESTLAFLRLHGQWFAAAVALFMSYVHWLVVRANELRPPQLSTSAIAVGLAVFLVLLVAWLVTLYVRFRRYA